MDRTALYFRQNVQVEPLSDSWYAWPYLIPPATNARNVVERHLRIMDSYIQTPQIHASAIANPKMRGVIHRLWQACRRNARAKE
jgi:hypothetical protein